jgi:hypothetical protein
MENDASTKVVFLQDWKAGRQNLARRDYQQGGDGRWEFKKGKDQA